MSVLSTLITGTVGPLPGYVRGRLRLAGIDLREPLGGVLDCVYAIVAEAPHDVLERWRKQLTMEGAKAWPERDTWGLTPEMQRLSAPLTAGQDEAPPERQPTQRGDGRRF